MFSFIGVFLPPSGTRAALYDSTNPLLPSKFGLQRRTAYAHSTKRFTASARKAERPSESDFQRLLQTTETSDSIMGEEQQEQAFTRQSPSPLNEDDRAEVHKITSQGEREFDKVADQVRNEICSLQQSTEALADKLIVQETEALLKKYQDQQTDLLGAVGKERSNIQQEMTELQALLDSNKSRAQRQEKGAGTKLKVLQSTTMLFGLASLIYAFNALANSDTQSMSNSLIDGAVAVCSAFFLSKSTERNSN